MDKFHYAAFSIAGPERIVRAMKYRSVEARIAIFHCKGGFMKDRRASRGGSRKEDFLEEDGWVDDDPNEAVDLTQAPAPAQDSPEDGGSSSFLLTRLKQKCKMVHHEISSLVGHLQLPRTSAVCS